MDPVTALTTAYEVISFFKSQQDEREAKEQMAALLESAATIANLKEAMRRLVQQLLQEQTIDGANANLLRGQLAYKDGELANAADYAEDAATRLMQNDVRLEGVLQFLTAAGANVIYLQDLVRKDPSKKAKLRNRARAYSDHATSMVTPVIERAKKRIEIKELNYPPFMGGDLLVYRIDGDTKGQREKNAANLAYLNGLRDHDARMIADEIFVALKVAAETWDAIADDRDPDYAAALDKVILVGSGNVKLVLKGHFVSFESPQLARWASKEYMVGAPDRLAKSFTYAGKVKNGAKCIVAAGRNPAFILREGAFAGHKLVLKGDWGPVIDVNDSIIEAVTGEEYDTNYHSAFYILEVDKYNKGA